MTSKQSELLTLALKLVENTCSCELRSSNGLISFTPATRKTLFHTKIGKSVTCVRCQIRRALEADGVLPPEPPLDRGGF